MPTPSETVTAFLAQWDRPGGLAQAIRDMFTETTVWENVGFVSSVGIDAALKVLTGFGQQADSLIMRVDTTALAASGGKVLTERIDHIVDPATGQPLISFPVMGVFEIADGKIAAWRDYFDTAGFAAQWQGGQGEVVGL
jgi:limonene-1,2-epoxide hydrolase